MAVTFAGGTVVDGGGEPAYRADVTVDGGRIVAISRAGRATGPVCDIRGLAIAPGFIDMHSHSDLALLTDPWHEAKITQGVTLEVVGQDGLSYAPADEPALAELRRKLAGWNGDSELLNQPWRSVAAYLRLLRGRAPVNAGYLVPHGTVRLLVAGAEDRPATAEELRRMCQIVDRAMTDGALGLSAGLTYTPGMYADTDELVALCAVVAARGGYYCPHHRSYGRGALDAYAEQIEIARRSGVALHLAHALLNYPVNQGRAGELIDLIDNAIAEGVDISFDSYPYLAGSSYLHALLPSWAQAGGHEATLRRLRDPSLRPRLRHELEQVGSDGNHGVPVDWAAVRVAGLSRATDPGAVGATVAELAERRRLAPSEVYLQLICDDQLGATALFEVGNPENVERLMTHPAHTVGSDGILVGARPHPRAWGAFPRYLGHYVRERGTLRLETAVAHLTGSAARRLRLADRGRVLPGHAADLVCFDPDTIADTATYQAPRQRSTGIRHVMVNGEFVMEDGELTGRRPGRAIRSTTTPSHPAATAVVDPPPTSGQAAPTLGEFHDESSAAGW
ncbi:MAG: N-acyl-D-amino-acid deacylase family protein [Micromonosporaceae bacterium]